MSPDRERSSARPRLWCRVRHASSQERASDPAGLRMRAVSTDQLPSRQSSTKLLPHSGPRPDVDAAETSSSASTRPRPRGGDRPGQHPERLELPPLLAHQRAQAGLRQRQRQRQLARVLGTSGRPTTSTGRLLWQDRRDRTAARRPTRLPVRDGGAVWTNAVCRPGVSGRARRPRARPRFDLDQRLRGERGSGAVGSSPPLVPGPTDGMGADSVDQTGDTSRASTTNLHGLTRRPQRREGGSGAGGPGVRGQGSGVRGRGWPSPAPARRRGRRAPAGTRPADRSSCAVPPCPARSAPSARRGRCRSRRGCR